MLAVIADMISGRISGPKKLESAEIIESKVLPSPGIPEIA